METQRLKDSKIWFSLSDNKESLSPGQKKMETQENSRKLRACGLEKQNVTLFIMHSWRHRPQCAQQEVIESHTSTQDFPVVGLEFESLSSLSLANSKSVSYTYKFFFFEQKIT